MIQHSEDLITRVVRDEIAGKNSAISAYDRMMWTVRTGVLTLLFAGWGLLLSASADGFLASVGRDPLTGIRPLLAAMYSVSVALSTAGFMVDLSYCRRKFRVIASLGRFLLDLASRGGLPTEDQTFRDDHLRRFLTISRDSDSREYATVPGYSEALWITVIIYVVPLVGVTVGGILINLLA